MQDPGDFDGISASQLDIDGAISVLLVQNLPLAPLLTKCCCVIHHGCPGQYAYTPFLPRICEISNVVHPRRDSLALVFDSWRMIIGSGVLQ